MRCLVRNSLFGLLLWPCWVAMAQTKPALPAQNLVVSVRQVDEPSGYSVSTQTPSQLQEQTLRLSNGTQGAWQLGQALPMLWVSSVASQNAQLQVNGSGLSAGTVSGAPTVGLQASSTGGAVSQSLTWMQAGQSLMVKPVWSGGSQVQLEIHVSAQTVDQRQGQDLPHQSSQQLSTTVVAPLGQWFTLAASGQPARAGVYGSGQASALDSKNPRRLLQVRVSLQ